MTEEFLTFKNAAKQIKLRDDEKKEILSKLLHPNHSPAETKEEVKAARWRSLTDLNWAKMRKTSLAALIVNRFISPEQS